MTLNKPFFDPEVGSLLAQIGSVISLIPAGSQKLLDCGCGSGWTSSFFAKYGLELTG